MVDNAPLDDVRPHYEAGNTVELLRHPGRKVRHLSQSHLDLCPLDGVVQTTLAPVITDSKTMVGLRHALALAFDLPELEVRYGWHSRC